MVNYSIKRKDNDNEVVFINYELKGYNFNPKEDSINNNLKINEIVIINPSLIDKILTIKFKQRYKRILMIVLSIINSTDSTESDCILALDEIAKVRDILLNKYKQFLIKEKETVFLEQLRGLENSLRAQVQDIRNYKNRHDLEQVQEINHGR